MFIPILGGLLVLSEELLGALGEGGGEGGVAGLVHQEFLVAACGGLGIQREGVLALRLIGGVEAEQVPVAALHGLLHLALAVGHAALDGVHLAGSVADNQGGTVILLGLADGGEGLVGVGAHGHLGHVDVAVLHGDLRQALLGHRFARGGKLGHLADVGGLGGLAAGVGVDLGVKDEDVDVFAGGDDVVQTAVADVVGPAVAAEDPHGFLHQVLLQAEDLSGQGAGGAVAVLLARGLEGLGVGNDLALLVAENLLAGIAGGKGLQLVGGHQALTQLGDVLLGGLGVGNAVVHSVQPLLSGLAQGGVHVAGEKLAGLLGQPLADDLLAQV